MSGFSVKSGWSIAGLLVMCVGLSGCFYEWKHQIQWDNTVQILLSEDSQVKLRSAHTRVFDTTDRTRLMEGVVAAMQDLNFQIDVASEKLGVFSGKIRSYEEASIHIEDSTYPFYDPDDELMSFHTVRFAWEPVLQRLDLARLTVTVRPRGEHQSLVRASLQHRLGAVEDPAVYRTFFTTLEKTLSLEAKLLENH